MAGRVVQLELTADRMTWVTVNGSYTARVKVNEE